MLGSAVLRSLRWLSASVRMTCYATPWPNVPMEISSLFPSDAGWAAQIKRLKSQGQNVIRPIVFIQVCCRSEGALFNDRGGVYVACHTDFWNKMIFLQVNSSYCFLLFSYQRSKTWGLLFYATRRAAEPHIEQFGTCDYLMHLLIKYILKILKFCPAVK